MSPISFSIPPLFSVPEDRRGSAVKITTRRFFAGPAKYLQPLGLNGVTMLRYIQNDTNVQGIEREMKDIVVQ